MLLRQTPQKKKHFHEISPPNSAQRNVRRSGSLQLAPEEQVPEDPTRTPMLKRQRTCSISILPRDNVSVMTPRLRPRTSSESRAEDLKSPVKMLTGSPMKKRVRYNSGSAPPSPLKKRYTSTATIRFGREEDGKHIDYPANLMFFTSFFVYSDSIINCISFFRAHHFYCHSTVISATKQVHCRRQDVAQRTDSSDLRNGKKTEAIDGNCRNNGMVSIFPPEN